MPTTPRRRRCPRRSRTRCARAARCASTSRCWRRAHCPRPSSRRSGSRTCAPSPDPLPERETAMPAQSSVPPFRADHVGSLLRPRALTHGFRQLAGGEITPADYRALQDVAIREVVALQRAAGLRVATDGEFRRGSYWGHFVDAVDGLSTKEALFDFHDASGNVPPFIAPHLSGQLRRARAIST